MTMKCVFPIKPGIISNRHSLFRSRPISFRYHHHLNSISINYTSHPHTTHDDDTTTTTTTFMSAHRSREPSSPIFAFDDPKMSVDHDPTMIFGPLDDFDDQHHQHHSALGVGVGALDLDLDMDMGLSFGIGIGLSPYLPPATAHNQQHQQNLQNNKYPFVEYDPEFASSPSMHPFPASPDSTSSQLDSGSAYHPQHQHHHMSPASLYSSSSPSPLSLALNASPDIPDNIYTHWLTDPDGAPSPVSASSTSVPIPIPNHLQAQPQQVHVYAQSPHHPHQHHPLSYVTFPSTSFASDSSYSSSSAFPDVAPFSPTTAYAALQRLPRSFSPYEHEDAIMTEALRASPRTPSSLASSSPASYSVLLSDAAAPFAAADEDVKRPQWASQLWSPDANVGVSTYAEDALDEDAFATQRPRRVSARMGLGLGVPMPLRRPTLAPVAQLFQSSSAPPASAMGLGLGMGGARSYSSRAGTESEEREGERDATIRKKKRASVGGGENAGMGREGEENGERARVDSRASEGKSSRDSRESSLPRLTADDLSSVHRALLVSRTHIRARARTAPLKSTLRPPKLAPSAWQLYFTDWIQRHQASSTKKLNVAQAAKEAGQEYARLSEEEKEVRLLRLRSRFFCSCAECSDIR